MLAYGNNMPYSGAYDKFVADMQRLGFTADQVEDLLTDDEEET